MKKVLSIILSVAMLICALALVSCGSKQEELIVYTEAGFAPWEFTEKGKTDVIGVDMEIAKYIADKYNYKLKVVNGSFDAIVAGISEDNALGIAGISWRADRAEAVEFSKFYWGDAFPIWAASVIAAVILAAQAKILRLLEKQSDRT